MTIDDKLGKQKIEVDLDKLLEAYYQIDELYIQCKKDNWKISDDLNFILIKLEYSTGLEYFRTLRKKVKKSDKQE